jgi:TolA-binding protein
VEERGQQAAPAARPAAPATPAAPAAAAGPRPPQRALAEGQAALSRREFQSAEAAAREVIASRDPARRQDAQILLGDALSGRRDFAGAAVAYDDAFRANRQSGRAPEAMLGIANALVGLGNAGDACAQLNQLRSQFPNLSGAVADRAAETRRRAQCR